jgi:tripartite ATP-independent transporter DctP family solute receptor
MNNILSRLGTAAFVTLMAASFVSGASAAEFTAKIGHLESDQQSRHVHIQKVADLVSERTNGAVAFEIYPQGQLGQQREMTEGVQLGTLEATVAPAAFLGGFNPVVSVLDIPFLLPENDEQAQEIRGGEFGDALCDTFSTRGVHCVTLWPNGKKHFTSRRPLASQEDFSGQRFRVMDSNILIEQFNALGASAVAIPFGELYTALQTGVVDGQENPLDTIQRMRYYEVQDHLVISGHGAMEDVVLFNPTWWESLPAEYQEIITDAFEEVIPELIAHKAAAVGAALEEIRENGMEIREMSAEEQAAFREAMYPAGRDAFIAQAGDEGASLIEVYEREYARVTE